MQSLASVSTVNAGRYLSQLCKHWSHKFVVAFDKTSGRIDLPAGVCLLTAGPGKLGLVLEAANDEGLTRLEDVVARHINRFAFREGELDFAWTRTAT